MIQLCRVDRFCRPVVFWKRKVDFRQQGFHSRLGVAWQIDCMDALPPASLRWPARMLAWLALFALFTPLSSAIAAETRCVILEVFVRGDSERSTQAREFIDKTYGARKGVKIVYRDVEAKESNLERLYSIAKHFKIETPGLPAVYVAGRFDHGWDEKVSPGRLDEALTVEVFVRHDCPRCQQAKPFLQNTVAPKYPGFKFVFKDIVLEAGASARMNEVAQRYRVTGTGVPSVHAAGKFQVGFNDIVSTGKQWEDTLRAVTLECKPEAPAAPATAPPQSRLDRDPRFHYPSAWGQVYAQDAPPPAADDDTAAPPPALDDAALPPPSADEPTTALKPVLDDAPDAPASSSKPKLILPEETGATEAVTVAPSQSSDVVHLPLIGDVNWRAWGLPAFTIMVGLVDGFNPCAMWVLMFLLSVLVNLKDRRKIVAVAGSFVFISGAAYYLFMAAWLNVFHLIGLVRAAQIALGILGTTVGVIHVKDFFAFKKGVSLSIPETAKSSVAARVRKIVMAESLLGAIIGASVLAVLVNIVELLCTAGLPAMYTGVLHMQQLPRWVEHLYLLLYIGAYMFDDSLMVAVVVITLGKHRLQETGGRVLKLISGSVILAIGLLMLFKPEWLG
jgi:glutaredoxin